MDVLISEAKLQNRVQELAADIAVALPGTEVVLVGPLKGACPFMTDLSRALYRHGVSVELDYLGLSSYGDGTVSKGEITVTLELQMELSGRPVLLVDDIADTGRTLAFARDRVLARKPSWFAIAVVLDKPSRRVVDVQLDYVGFEIPDLFVLGYGADLAQKYRELPFIGVKR